MCCWCCRWCCEDFYDEYCDYDCDICPDMDDIKQLLHEWREDYTVIFISQFSRIHTSLVSQTNAYILMFFMAIFEITVFALQALSLSEIISRPNSNLNWNKCNHEFDKIHLQRSHTISSNLLPVSATLLSLGAFFCCYLCKPPYGILIGAILRYPFAVTMMVFSWYLHTIYSSVECPALNTSSLHALQSFSLNLCIFYTLIVALMCPTWIALYYISFNICSLFHKIYTDCYIPCMTRMACCNCIFSAFLCCFCCRNVQTKQDLLNNRRIYVNNRMNDRANQQNYGTNNNNNHKHNKKTNWTQQQRKQLVEKSVGECPLCFNKECELILTRGCKHAACVECLKQYILSDLKNVSSYPRKCFWIDCNILINYTHVEYVLCCDDDTNMEWLEEYDRMLILSSVNNTETISCNACNAVMVKPKQNERNGNGSGNLMHCVNVNCQNDLCSECGVQWHMNKTCEEYQAELKSKTSGADKAFEILRNQENWQKCPNCGLVVERTEGCYHMTHYGCNGGVDKRTDFCYFCGEILMKKAGEGWRYSKKTQEKHFEDGVFSPCVHELSKNSLNIMTNDDDDDGVIVLGTDDMIQIEINGTDEQDEMFAML